MLYNNIVPKTEFGRHFFGLYEFGSQLGGRIYGRQEDIYIPCLYCNASYLAITALTTSRDGRTWMGDYALLA
jgi:hypothetical protein